MLALAGLLLVPGLSCNGTEENGDGGPPKTDGKVTPDLPPLPPGLVTVKNAGESADADFSGGSEEYLVVPFSVSDVAASAIDFEIKVQSGGGGGADGGIGTSYHKLRWDTRPLKLRNPGLWAYWQRRLAVERWQRDLAERAAKAKMRAPGADLDKTMAACTLSSECAATEVCHAGQCAATVKIKTGEFSSTAEIDAEVKKKGKLAAILVDSGDTVSQGNVDAMLEKFESLIHPCDVGLYGDPPLKDGEKTTSSDRNGDGIVWLVFTSKVAEQNAVGFFVATDFDDTNAKSNKTDILYIDAGITELEKAYSTMTHEFQHLLNFGSKVYKPTVAGGQGSLEALWLDEGQAHFAEDACGWGGENVTLLDQEVFTAFSDGSLLVLDKADDSAAMRGRAFTFVRWLFEKQGGVSYESDGKITDKGGAKVLQTFHTTTKLGVEAVNEAYGDGFKKAFEGWITAVALDGRGVQGAAALEFQDLVKHPVTGNDTGVVIRGKRKDESGAEVNLQGPLEEALSGDKQDTIPNGSAKFFLLKGQTGKVTVTVTTQESDFRFALIKIK
jgi:hypothetical protein